MDCATRFDPATAIVAGGPWFEDLERGMTFDRAPAMTLTEGHAAAHLAAFGDRLRLPLDASLCRAVTGRAEPLAHPALVANLAIGQTTEVTQRVRANLFYRGMVLLRPVHLGDTLRTTTEVVALKQNARRPGKPATGLVLLRCRTENQRGEAVLDFVRCPMLPLRDATLDTGHADSIDAGAPRLDASALGRAVPSDWRLEEFRALVPGPHAAEVVAGVRYEPLARDTVTGAPEVARLTLNLAAAHTDAEAAPGGRRLVFGGHTIAMACAQAVRAIPSLVTILGWHGCDHTGPVHEGDVLATTVTLEDVVLRGAGGGLAHVRAVTTASSGPGDAGRPVLDWRFVGLMA